MTQIQEYTKAIYELTDDELVLYWRLASERVRLYLHYTECDDLSPFGATISSVVGALSERDKTLKYAREAGVQGVTKESFSEGGVSVSYDYQQDVISSYDRQIDDILTNQLAGYRRHAVRFI